MGADVSSSRTALRCAVSCGHGQESERETARVATGACCRRRLAGAREAAPGIATEGGAVADHPGRICGCDRGKGGRAARADTARSHDDAARRVKAHFPYRTAISSEYGALIA